MSHASRQAAVTGAPGRYRQHLLLGAALIIASELLFATMGAAVKAVSAELPTAMVVLFRSAFGTLIFLPLLGRRGDAALWPSRGTWPLYAFRAGVGVSAMACFFHALEHLPLADGMLLKMTAPVFMPLVAILWLAERPSRTAWLAVPVGLAGVVLVLDPTGRLEVAALVGTAGGLLAAVAKVAVRRLTRTEPAARVVFWFAILATLYATPFALFHWQTPTLAQWLLLLAVGLCASVGQWLLTRGYGAASPSQIGPFTYSSVVFAGLYGALLWGEIPDGAFAAGALLIAAAGLLALRREAPPPAAVDDSP